MAAKKQAPKSAYAKAGVDTVKADLFVDSISKLVTATHNEKVQRCRSGYAGLYEISTDQYIAATTDGVGTKLKLAFGLKKHDTVGIDLVAMSVNDLICVGAKPLLFLDYFATGELDLKTSQEVLKGIAEGCKRARVALIGGETAEMPSLYGKGEYDLAGFAVGLVSKSQLIDGERICAGDVVLGLESSGAHSNGFSLIRKLLKPADKALMQEFLTPTKIYVDDVLALQQEFGTGLKGLAHITGSGFLNIPRVNTGFDYDLEVPDTFDMPELFGILKKRGKLTMEELYTTFNMGFGMVAVVESALAVKAQNVLRRRGVASHVLGKVVRQRKPGKAQVHVRGNFDGEDFQLSLQY